MKIITPYSTGKDSQAAVLWAKEKFKNIDVIFCDVGWEREESYEHLKYFEKVIGQEIKILKSSKYAGMVDLAMKKKRFPSTMARFCTEELKVKPMIDYVLTLEDHIIVVDGIRADESEKRSKMSAECRFFKYYFEPYESNSMIVERFTVSPPVTLKQKNKLKKAQERLAIGKEDEKFYTYRKEEIFEWCKKYDDSLIRPFFHSTANDVIYFSLNRDVHINPLYFHGYSRVGCKVCINENLAALKITITEFPEIIYEVIEAEEMVGHSFFAPDKVPKRYRSQTAPNGKKYALMADVQRYILESNATGDLFKDEPIFKCKSVYNICE